MQLIEVTDNRTAREFLEFPVTLYHEHPKWIRPLDNDIDAVFDPKKNANFEKGEAIRWLLVDDKNTTIGRVAAFINDSTKNADDFPVGGMGFFESIDNQEAANVLFDACKTWLAARGVEAMDGPINFGERDKWWGLLVEGFTEPNYGMFYHMPYYQQLFENYGFQVYFKQLTCFRSVQEPMSEPFRARVNRALNMPGYSYRHASKNDLEKLASDFYTVYSKAWASHSGISRMTMEKARSIVQQMKPVMDERLVWFGYYNDEPVGFFVMLPELNQIFQHLHGKLNLLGKLKFLWHKFKLSRRKDIKKAFGIIFGVVPEHQGKGVEMGLIGATEDMLKGLHYIGLEMNWIGDFNPKMLSVLRVVGASVCKTHITYRKLFDESRPFERYPIIK
jgi:GNAT superfamily N-acetyltransferase